MKKIVVGIDGSPQAQQALRWAVREAALRHCTVHAVLAYDVSTLTGPLASIVAPAVPADLLEAQAKGTLEASLAALGSEAEAEPGRVSATITSEIVSGHAGPALVDASDGAELLVVGTHGRSGLHRLHLGSISGYCVHNARCPVVVVPAAANR